MYPTAASLTQDAIHAALQGDWKAAINLNLHITQLEPNNIAALNRLAKAYEEISDFDKSRKTYQKVLHHDKYNRIALNNLDRLKVQQKSPRSKKAATSPLSSFSFIEEPGKTRTVSLTKLAPHQTLSLLKVSLPVLLKPKKRVLSVTTTDNLFIGYIPDDLSLHLGRLIKLGNKYEAAIKTANKTQVEIFIRETKRTSRLKGLPSFPTKDTQKLYQFLPTEPIAEVPLELTDDDSLDLDARL